MNTRSATSLADAHTHAAPRPDINASLDTAGRLMQSIMKRIWGNKLILGFVMLLLVAGLVCIVWLRFFPPWEHGGAAQGGGNHTNPHPPPPRE